MDLQLSDKRALVTGSTAGIGYAIAQTLAAEGATVIVNGRTQKRVDEAMRKLASQNLRGKVEGLAADLGTAAGARTAIVKYPEVDILVNNLGIFEPKAFEKIPDEDWLRFFEVNVLSGVRLSRHYLPLHEEAELGTNRFRFQRVCIADSLRDGPLWDDQNGPACDRPRASRDNRRHQRHR